MLECGGVMKTWRLAEEPRTGQAVDAEPIADHRLHYLDYEGPVSGERGRVTRWDRGSLVWIRNDDDNIILELNGAKLECRCELIRDGTKWVLTSSQIG